MNPYSVLTEEEKSLLLDAVGISSVDDLFSDVPASLYQSKCDLLEQGISEFEALKKLTELSEMNIRYPSFLGCGSYDHIIPSAVTHLSTLPQFLTSYTPYQPEVSQGTLQAIFEFQSMIVDLTGLEVSNASLYDGHTAASEAVVMASLSKRKGSVLLVSETIHPYTLQVLKTHTAHAGISIELIPHRDGRIVLEDLKRMISPEVTGVLVQSPNIFGILEDYTGFAEIVHEHKALLIISSNPMSLGVLKTPAEWGADIAIGDVQPFGIPACFGGPSAGYIACTKRLMRRLPGRIVGESVDVNGKRAFVLTLQAREQHIKRERASSNICSNQAQTALTAAVYMSIAGPSGLREVISQSYAKACYLAEALRSAGLEEAFPSQPHLGEFTLRFPDAEAARYFLKQMQQKGIFAGVHLGDLSSGLSSLVAVSVTEKRTKEELDRYIQAAREVTA